MNEQTYYLGIEINDQTAMISYFASDMTEPDTVRTPEGEEYYQFPLSMAQKNGSREWNYGLEADRLIKEGCAIPVNRLLTRALAGEEIVVGEQIYAAGSLLGIYLDHLIRKTGFWQSQAPCKRIILVLENVNQASQTIFSSIMEQLGYSAADFVLIDKKSAFCSFALKQREQLWTHDVLLFEYRDHSVRYYDLSRYTRVVPQIVSIKESRRYALSEDRDREFTQLLKNTLEKRHVSTVYLVGDGFDGGWMKISLNYLCRGRRAFIGKNLFSKGACYHAWIMDHRSQWPFVYLGENEMKFSLLLPVRGAERMITKELITAGTHVDQAKASVEVIVDGSMELDVIKKEPAQRDSLTETLVMEGFPKRKERMTRLSIEANAVSDTAVELCIRDLGFGSYYKSSGKTWHFAISI